MKRTNMKAIDRGFDKAHKVLWDKSYSIEYKSRRTIGDILESLRETIYRKLLKARKGAYQEGYEDGLKHSKLIAEWSQNNDK